MKTHMIWTRGRGLTPAAEVYAERDRRTKIMREKEASWLRMKYAGFHRNEITNPIVSAS